MDHQVSRMRLLGLFFCLAGGFAITFGWAGTAQVACVDCQVPYLISGGAGGVALTIVGTGLLVIAQLRVEGNRIAQRLAPPPPADRAAAPDALEEARTEPISPLTIADRNAR
ncbi:MAG: hypothetical protein GEV12_09285 [Micromonosporaceae bacterium]|nr:hypothetical protein [Micromonosporaceae bacterium]